VEDEGEDASDAKRGGEALTPAVTRRRSTGVHSRIDYTGDQLERLTTPSPSTPHGVHSRISYTSDQLDRPTPPSPSTPHVEIELTVTVNTTADLAHTGVDNQPVQPEETKSLYVFRRG
jgi:hypothetical protein